MPLRGPYVGAMQKRLGFTQALVAAVIGIMSCVLTSSALAATPISITPLGNTSPQGPAAAEISAYHSGSARAFATNAAANRVDIFNLADPAAPASAGSIDLNPYGAVPNSVVVSNTCGGRVVVAVEAAPKTSPGTFELFDLAGNHLDTAPAGALPDMVAAASNGRTFVSANEGEPASNGSVDPNGSISIAKLHKCDQLNITTIDFAGVVIPPSVRIFGLNASSLQDLEPEYVAIAPGNRKAYVTLQENNAVAIVDLADQEIEAVRPLGFKNHGLPGNALDPSDRDGGANIATWPNLYGMYQPDAIGAYKLADDKTRLITANEGDARDWSYFSEESRVKDLTLDPTAFPNGERADSKLGRLNVTKTLGDTDGDGDYDRLYAFGGRSISQLDANGSMTWDSGDQLEQYIAANAPTTFNWECVLGGLDSRSDNKGPEPEGLAIGEVDGTTFAFAGLERQGGIVAYDLSSDPGTPEIAGYVNNCTTNTSPEGISFIPKDESPTDGALLLTTNEVSGTLGVYSVDVP